MMYRWRKLTAEQRREVLKERKLHGQPRHSVPHYMKSEGHYYATLNYVLHNAVHHGYATKWTEWPYSNAAQYLEDCGREQALQIWTSYPLYDYGKDWDPPEM